LEIDRQLAEEEQRNKARLKNEITALRERENNERKQRELEEKRKRDAEELAKRHKDMVNVPPALPSVKEEEDVFIVEFGETELHRQAAVQGANLSKLLRESYHSIASRNSEGKTPRDVAIEAKIQENADQIDEYCVELLHNGNYKALNDLLLCGYAELADYFAQQNIIPDDLTRDGETDQANYITQEIPQLLKKIKDVQQAIRDGNMQNVDMLVDRKAIALYRDKEGFCSLHDCVDSRQFEIATFLVNKYPSLALVRDVRDRTSLDLLNEISEDSLSDEQRESYEQLKEALVSAVSAQND